MRPIEDLDIEQLAAESFRIASEHGFHETPDDVNEKLVLAIGELVEAQNELRDGHAIDTFYYKTFHQMDGEQMVKVESPEEIPPGFKPEGFGVELADAVIRILDLMQEKGLPVRALFASKMAYNETRPYKHGKAF